MFLARLAIKQPVFITMVLLAVALVGVLSYTRMGVDLYPDMSNPTVSISISFPGASPQDVETMVTKPVESAVSTVSGVDTISSSSREGSSMVTISFVIGHDLQQGAQEIRERLEMLKRRFPDGVDDPVLRRFDPNTSPFLNAALSIQGNLTPVEMRRMVDEIVVPRIERLSGVASASVGGLSVQQIDVDLNAAKLKALRVTAQQVTNALRAENTVMPSGRITSTELNMPLRTSAQFQSLDEVRDLIVARQGNNVVHLRDVADVNVRYPDRQSYTRVNGQDSLVLSVQKQSGSNVVETARLVRNELQNLRRDFPQISFTMIRDDSTFIEESDRDVTLTLILGALLAAAIVFVFFRNIRNTLITVAGLPLIVISTFSVIYMLGFTRNIISLMALSLSVGLLIDDAIVVRENIFRYMEAGASPREAAVKATGEIAFAVLAITLTIVAIFIPVTFMTGQTGVLLKQFGITVAVAVMVSLFEAFTLAPLLTAYFAKQLTQKHAMNAAGEISVNQAGLWSRVTSGYKSVLTWSLRHRLIVVVAAVATFALSLWLLRFLPTSFFPASTSSSLSVGINQPPGTTIGKTDAIAREVERFALAQPEVKQIYAQVNATSASLSITLAKDTEAAPLINRFRSGLSQYGRTLTFSQPQQFMGVGGGFGGTNVRGRPVTVAVRGPTSLELLDQASEQVIERLRTVPGLRDIEKSLPAREPELQIIVDRARTDQTGISASTIGSTIRTLISGTTATQMDLQGQTLDVNVRLRPEDRSNSEAIMDLPISGASGELWPLRSLASIEQGSGPAVLDRQERQGQIVVGANLEGRSQGAVMPDVQKALTGLSLPAGITWRFAGQQAQTQNAFSSLMFALMLGLIFIYMVLASQFGSVIHPLTVMVALPMSTIGAMLALVIVRADLTVIAMIGIILLMGLATKNSILLVDFIIRYRKEGRSQTEAVVTAGPVRLRPILMTTLAVVLGMIPTALGLGAAGSFRSPMAIAVIGGVFSSTLLSLVVVPVAYTLMDDVFAWVSRGFRRSNPIAVTPNQITMPVQSGSPAYKLSDPLPPDPPEPDRNETASEGEK